MAGMESDGEAVRGTVGGETERYAGLVRRYEGSLYRRAYRFTCDAQAAQDLVQEAFLRAYRRLDRLTDPARFGSWVRSILDNECRMWLRRSTSRPEPVDLPSESLLPAEDGTGGTPEEQLHRGELRRTVEEVCRTLPPALRTVAWLFYVTGMPCREISAALGVTPATVESRLFKARAAVRRIVAGGGRTERQRGLADALYALTRKDFIMDDIRIEISTQLIPWVRDEGQDKGLLSLLRGLREDLEAEQGMRLPKVRVIDNAALAAYSFSLFIREQGVASGTVRARGELPAFQGAVRRALLDHRYGMTRIV